MGIFDSAFGAGVAKITDEVNFNRLKEKYDSALDTLDKEGGRVQTLHFEGEQLVVIGVVPTEDAKNRIWDQIKAADANYADIKADLTVDPSQFQGATETYTVQAGDSLWRIADRKLGDGNRYMEIFYANRHKLDTPKSVIHPGDELNIPVG